MWNNLQKGAINMETKVFEIRDKATFVVVLATMIDQSNSEPENYLFRRAGFGSPLIQLTSFNRSQSQFDPYDWGDRTYTTAHDYIEKNWYGLYSGEVIDIEYILKETTTKKISERLS